MEYNIVTATFDESHFAITSVLYQYNYGNILVFEGIENLPEYFEVHFANKGDETTRTQIGHDGQVEIPDEYLETGKQIIAYIYLHETAADGETVYKTIIPVRNREEPSDVQPTPEQQDVIAELLDALNTQAGIATDAAEEAAGSAESAEANAKLSESWAVGETGTREGEDTNNAKFWALVAQQGAEHSGYAIFNVDDSDGQMYVTITDPLANDVSFLVDENLGTLEVTING